MVKRSISPAKVLAGAILFPWEARARLSKAIFVPVLIGSAVPLVSTFAPGGFVALLLILVSFAVYIQ
ncbi:MAG: hypothetical protein AAF699_17340, partial [Pseudomonadota bacterium]